MDKINIILILILFFVFSFYFSLIQSIEIEDATRYVCSAKSFSHYGILEGEWYSSGFGFSLFLSIFSFLEDINFIARFFSAFFGFLNLFLIAIVMHKFFEEKENYLLYIFPLFFSFPYLARSLFGYATTFDLFLFFLSLFFLLNYKTSKKIIIASVFFAFSFWTRITHILFTPFFFFSLKENKKNLAIFSLILFFSIMFFLLLLKNTVLESWFGYVSYSRIPAFIVTNFFTYLADSVLFFPLYFIFFPLGFFITSRKTKLNLIVFSLPLLLFYLVYPFGNWIYYVFPLLPFFMVLSINGFRHLIAKLNSNKNFIKRAVYFFVTASIIYSFCFAPLVFNEINRVNLDNKAAVYLKNNAEKDSLIITSFEGFLLSEKLNNWGICNFNEKPYLILLPYSIEKLWSGKDVSELKEKDIINLNYYLENGLPIYVTKSALEKQNSSWCKQLECISLDGLELTEIKTIKEANIENTIYRVRRKTD